MINASEARNASVNANSQFKNSKAFQYAMKKIENDITSEIKKGNTYIKHHMSFLCEDDEYPDDILVNAVKQELSTNGYFFEKQNIMDMRGYSRTFFKISW